MFRKLRNKLILINLGVTTLVIVVVFAMIYMISTQMAENRPRRSTEELAVKVWSEEVDSDNNGIPDEFDKIFNQGLEQERAGAAQSLLMTLIFSGVAIEIVVTFISYLMAEEAIKPVKEAYVAQKIFIANASHEIKTPLAAIQANLEAADIRGNKWIKNVEFEAERLAKLNTELLNLARTDLASENATEETDLREVVLRAIESVEPRLNGKTLKKEISMRRKLKINRADFEQLLMILLDNAIKYSESKISLKLTEKSLKIANDGVNIPKEKLAHVFERFYQVDKTREGVGLGLSIAKALADKNHWEISVTSDKYTTFSVNF